MALRSYKSKPAEENKVEVPADQQQESNQEENKSVTTDESQAEATEPAKEQNHESEETKEDPPAQAEAEETAAPVETKPAATEETAPQMVSVDVVNKLFKKIEDLEKAQEANFDLIVEKKKPGQAYSMNELPVKDFLEVPAVFFAFASYFAIHGDKRMNKMVSTPYETKIEFKKAYRWEKKGRGGRGTDTVTISQAIVRSKKEAEWLRSHSKYQITFFESMKKAQDTDPSYAQELADASAVVSGMGDMNVIERAKNENMDVMEDLDIVRKNLIKSIADKNIKGKRAKRLEEVERMNQTETVTNLAERAEKQPVT